MPMKTPATDNEETQLQETLNRWQDQQTVSGNVFLFLCLIAFVSFVLFCLDPCGGSMWLLLISLFFMVYSGSLMFRSASAVVQHKQQLLQFPATPAFVRQESPEPVLPASSYYGVRTLPAAGPDDASGPWIAFPKKRTDSQN